LTALLLLLQGVADLLGNLIVLLAPDQTGWNRAERH
jgi:hypothetical protein